MVIYETSQLERREMAKRCLAIPVFARAEILARNAGAHYRKESFEGVLAGTPR
jgi:hypothetical protein